MSSSIKYSLSELRNLMDYRGIDGVEYFNSKYANINEFCNGLCTSTTDGLCDQDDIAVRRNVFGKNIYRDQKPQQMVNVIRSSQNTIIPAEDIVVGDVCLAKKGDNITADCLVVESNDLQVDECMLTGESDSIKKGVNINLQVLSGSKVVVGNGKLIVIAVGPNSQVGIVMTVLDLQSKTESEKNV